MFNLPFTGAGFDDFFPYIFEGHKYFCGVAEWFTALCCGTQFWVRTPLPPPMLLDMLSASTWISFHADLYTVRRCCARGESEDHTCEKAHEQGIHPGFEIQSRRHQKGYQWPHKKDLSPPKYFFKKTNKRH